MSVASAMKSVGLTPQDILQLSSSGCELVYLSNHGELSLFLAVGECTQSTQLSPGVDLGQLSPECCKQLNIV